MAWAGAIIDLNLSETGDSLIGTSSRCSSLKKISS